MKKTIPLLITVLLFFLAIPAQSQQTDMLPNKIVPLDNPIYEFLEYYEATGLIPSLPVVRPYTRETIIHMLEGISTDIKLTNRERRNVKLYLDDMYRSSNAWVFKEEDMRKSYGIFGARADITGRYAFGKNSTGSNSSLFEPFIAGSIRDNISMFGSVGAAIERLAPDMFYGSYVKDGQVNSPLRSMGFSYHPYQFDFETMRAHYGFASAGGGYSITENLSAGLIYRGEMNISLLEDALRINIHNQRRSWGNTMDNLNLSASARRFPGIDMVIQPVPWMKYSMLVGSLFSYFSQSEDYKQDIYGYDLGHTRKLLTLHMIEFNPESFLQVTATSSNIWSKRMEPAYFLPMLFPPLTQVNVGDKDNLNTSINFAAILPDIGKLWFEVFFDQWSFSSTENMLKMARNHYAWQVGWNTNLAGRIIPGTQLRLGFTRLSPFVYTHKPETDFEALDTDRPIDMSYTHDEVSLGFYLPPNSAEIKADLVNVLTPDLLVKLKNRFIIHGSNDLASDSLMIHGDLFRWQAGNVNNYPLTQFMKDGIYDYTWFSELCADWKVRNVPLIGYFRVMATLGISYTWFEPNNSGIADPGNHTLFSGAIGIIIDL